MDASHPTLSRESLLEHAAWIRKLARELVRDPGAAEDLAQDTWLAFLRNRPDPTRPLRPWLATVLRNAATTRARRRASRSHREKEHSVAEGLPSSQELVVRAEEQKLVTDAVLTLEDPYRSVLLLRYYEGLSPKQIASARGVPASTIRVQLHRGLGQLREHLDREHSGDRRAWVLMLQPLLPSKEVAVGVGLKAIVGTLAIALLVAALGYGLNTRAGDAGLGERTIELAQADRPVTLVGVPAENAPMRQAKSSVLPATRPLQLNDQQGIALAYYQVSAEGQTYTTNADGQLELPSLASTLTCIDTPGLARDVQTAHLVWERQPLEAKRISLDPSSEVEALVLASGPTYTLQLRPLPPRESKLEARLLPPSSAGTRLPIQVAPIRYATDGQPWVRFHSTPAGIELAPNGWQLEVRDRWGKWHGTSQLTQARQLEAAPMAIALTNTASLKVVLDLGSNQQGSAVLAGLRLPEQTGNYQYSAAGDGNGAVLLNWVMPGEYEIELLHPGWAPFTESISLDANEGRIYAPYLTLAGRNDEVRGTIRSSSTQYSGQLLVFLLDLQDETIEVWPTTWKAMPGGDLEAEFHFEVEATGRMHLDVVSLSDFVSFRAETDHFRAGATDLEVTLLDLVPASDWAFLAKNASNATNVREFDLEIQLSSGSVRTFRRRKAEQGPDTWTQHAGGMRWNKFTHPTALRALPDDTQFSWTLSAPGYESAHGTQTDFDLLRPGQRICAVQLRPK